MKAGKVKIKNQKTPHSALAIIILCAVTAALYIVSLYADKNSKPLPEENELGVYFIDSGQADAALITVPDAGNILVDTGLYENRTYLTEYIKSLGIRKIDYLILSHPHSDHIGGACDIIDNFFVKKVVMSDTATDTPVFERILCKIDEEDIPLVTVYENSIITLGDAKITFLSPDKQYESLNDMSTVFRVDYGKMSFLFTGDAEEKVEKDIISGRYASLLDVDVLKVAHHGSSTSSSEEFLKAISPEYAVISCGKNNEFGHPHRTTLDKLKELGTVILRTDNDGTVIFASDGNTLRLIG